MNRYTVLPATLLKVNATHPSQQADELLVSPTFTNHWLRSPLALSLSLHCNSSFTSLSVSFFIVYGISFKFGANTMQTRVHVHI